MRATIVLATHGRGCDGRLRLVGRWRDDLDPGRRQGRLHGHDRCRAHERQHRGQGPQRPGRRSHGGGAVHRGLRLLRKGAELTHTAVTDLEAIGPPPADAAKIIAWVNGLAAHATLLDQIVDAMDKRDTTTSKALSARLATNAATAKRLAVSCGFKGCGGASG